MEEEPRYRGKWLGKEAVFRAEQKAIRLATELVDFLEAEMREVQEPIALNPEKGSYHERDRIRLSVDRLQSQAHAEGMYEGAASVLNALNNQLKEKDE